MGLLQKVPSIICESYFIMENIFSFNNSRLWYYIINAVHMYYVGNIRHEKRVSKGMTYSYFGNGICNCFFPLGNGDFIMISIK